MSIDANKSIGGSKKSASTMSKDMLMDDDSFDEDQTSMKDDEYLRKDKVAMRSKLRHRRQHCFFVPVIMLVTLLVVILAILGVYFVFRKSIHGEKPFTHLCRMHYHEWKSGGKDKDFLLEGEFYQQVEIDYISKSYEKLNVPKVLNSESAIVMHDFRQQLTTIVDHDRSRCFVMAINATLVKPLSEFYDIVQNIKAGYDSPDTEVLRDTYLLLKPAVKDVEVFGTRIFDSCHFYKTFRLERDEHPLAVSEGSEECSFKGQQYCLGSAGTQFLPIITISRCVE